MAQCMRLAVAAFERGLEAQLDEESWTQRSHVWLHHTETVHICSSVIAFMVAFLFSL